MAGYSGTPLLRKLGIRDHHVVLLDRAPDTFELGETGASEQPAGRRWDGAAQGRRCWGSPAVRAPG
jgi:hypothetical protein